MQHVVAGATALHAFPPNFSDPAGDLRKGVRRFESLDGERSFALLDSPRQHINIDFDWRFLLGDPLEARSPGYADGDWRQLDLPHDWSIEGTYDEDHPAGVRGGFLPTGVGWYRKALRWNPEWEGRRVRIVFDGVYMNSDVWINGLHLGQHPYGYTGFSYDLTPHLQEERNVIAVRVDHRLAPSGRWYTGSGIYRHVWLEVTAPVHVAHNGTYVRTPEVSERQASMLVDTEVLNEGADDQTITLDTRVLDEKGEVVAQTSTSHRVASGGGHTFAQKLEVAEPTLWSPDSPTTYSVESQVLSGEEMLDAYRTVTGFRWFEFTTDRGFVLNGVPTEIKGMCMHHDAGPVGAAVPEDVLHRRLKALKEMGANAIRTAHNPAAPELYAMANAMGFLIMDEAFDGWHREKAKFDYGLYFEQWWKKDLTSFIRRDRNHPSVVLWSIGNEVRGYTPKQQKKMVSFVHALDPTRPVTQGRGYAGGHLDVAGFNGHGEVKGSIEAFHAEHPDTPVIGTEMTHTYHTRNVYRTQTEYRTRDFPGPWEASNHLERWEDMKSSVYIVPDLTEEEVFTDVNPHYRSSYDNCLVRMCARDQIRISRRLPYLAGTFRWVNFDYLGESYGWPARAHESGIFDLAGFPKDHVYLYQSQWSDKPMVHLLPHWTHPGKEGIEIPIVVYTNQEGAELFLNERSLGAKTFEAEDQMQLVWKVPYEPGELRVVATSGGDPVVEKAVQTADAPAAVRGTLDRETVRANRRDVVHVEIDITDKAGYLVPDAGHEVRFEIEGPANLIGVENGDILDLSPHKVPYRRAFKGKCLAMVQATDEAGLINITARAEGLEPAVLQVQATSSS